MKEDPLVSILIPIYNAEKYFSETIESLLAQTYKNIEIIMVDDGSTDGSLAVAKQYAKLYKHIHVYTQKNSGASASRNKAFEMSSGEYIQYFDADDIMHPEKITIQMNELKQYGFQDNIVATGKFMRFFNSIDNAVFKDKIINQSYDDKFLFLKDAWENMEWILGQSWLIPRKINEEIGGWDIQLNVNDDVEFFTRVAYGADKIIYLKESIVYYRQDNQNSISSDKSLRGFRSHLDAYKSCANLVKNDLQEHSLHKGLATLYSDTYSIYYPMEKKQKEEVLGLIRDMGYNQPLIKFKPTLLWIVKIFGIDAGLRLRILRTKLYSLLKRK